MTVRIESDELSSYRSVLRGIDTHDVRALCTLTLVSAYMRQGGKCYHLTQGALHQDKSFVPLVSRTGPLSNIDGAVIFLANNGAGQLSPRCKYIRLLNKGTLCRTTFGH